mgnify:FL=1
MTEHTEAWWIDCDPGVDDALAIIMACAYGKNVVGLSCTFGNTYLEHATKNCAKILEVIDRKIPIYKGSSQPLSEHFTPESDGFFGKDALGDSIEYQHLKGYTDCIKEENGSLAMIRASKEAKAKNQKFIVIALAPLTTVAIAIALDKTLKDRVDKLLIMGGTVYGRGFTMMSTEFNFDRDPDAAYRVIRDFDNVTIVPTETATTGAHTLEETIEFRSIPTKVGKFWREISRVICIDRNDENSKNINFFFVEILEYVDAIYDAVTMCVALDESVIKKMVTVRATVDTRGKYTRGGLVAHWEDVNKHHDEYLGDDSKSAKKVNIVMELHREKVIALMSASMLKFE